MTTRHPTQPTELDERGVRRFKRNHIVEYLLNHGGIDLNAIACLDFPREDRVQFAQLIGYSVDGFSTLSYVDDCDYAVSASEVPRDPKDAFRSGFGEGKLSLLQRLQELIEEQSDT